jgi:hypothetical protein
MMERKKMIREKEKEGMNRVVVVVVVRGIDCASRDDKEDTLLINHTSLHFTIKSKSA